MPEPTDSLLKLQNGSDVRGIAIEGVPGEDVNLTPDIAKLIAAAFAARLANNCKKSIQEIRIGVGHDSRLSGPSLQKGVIDGLLAAGCEVFDCGLASTPAMFMGTVFEDTHFDGSIMITASHLPFNKNGLKFFDKNGGYDSSDIKEILTKASSFDTALKIHGKEPRELKLIDEYSRFLCEKIKAGVNSRDYEHPLKGLKVVLDAGNGDGGFFAEKVLLPLGADTTGSQFLDPDGRFPNHIPNPENAQAMESVQKATVANKADLGIIFDTDVDRASFVFPDGQEINRNALIGLTTAVTAKQYPGTTIVTDSVTSDHLTDFIENSLGMKHHRFKRGYKNVINEAIRLNKEGIETHVAIETSGHCAFKENYFLDDGAYLGVKILIEAAKCKTEGNPITKMLENLGESLESKEIRLKIKDDNYKAYGAEVLNKFEAYAADRSDFLPVANNYEGIRVTFNDKQVKGWMLLRMSLHEPLMPLNIEADNEGGVKAIIDRIQPFFEEMKQLDIANLK